MKEAAGEANMTVVTIVLIAIVLGVGTLIVGNMMSSQKKSSCCQSNGGVWHDNECHARCDIDANGNKTNCSGEVSTKCSTTE